MSQALALQEAFERALEAIPARVLHGGLAIGYSGGLDSTVLLHLAARWANEHGLPVHALHVHHGLSPHADAWSLHCQQVCAALYLSCQILRVEVKPEDGGGLEQAARQARYQALLSTCQTLGVSALLTAHHQDDQAETVLLNLLRGSGVAGLGGMREAAARGPESALHLLRPLLDQPRARLQAWAAEHGLSWVEDESNQALHLRRNLVRHVLLPAIEAQFPAAAPVLARSAAHLRDAQDLLAQLAAIDMRSVGREQGAGLDVSALAALPQTRIDNLLRHWLGTQGLQAPSTAQLEQLRVQMLQAGQDRQPQCRFGNALLVRAGGAIRLAPAWSAPCVSDIALTWEGQSRFDFPDWHGSLLVRPNESGGLPAELLREELRLSARRGGERLRLHVGRPSRSLKNLYQEQGIPAWSRGFLPLIYSGQHLLYAAGLGMDSRYLKAEAGFSLHWESDLTG
jgi:tRNA(Ile)-lysidine synthase